MAVDIIARALALSSKSSGYEIADLTIDKDEWVTSEGKTTNRVEVVGVTESSLVILSCKTKADETAYADGGCFADEQQDGYIVFTCDSVPSSDIDLNVCIFKG